jgi:hypothetical protein
MSKHLIGCVKPSLERFFKKKEESTVLNQVIACFLFMKITADAIVNAAIMRPPIAT